MLILKNQLILAKNTKLKLNKEMRKSAFLKRRKKSLKIPLIKLKRIMKSNSRKQKLESKNLSKSSKKQMRDIKNLIKEKKKVMSRSTIFDLKLKNPKNNLNG